MEIFREVQPRRTRSLTPQKQRHNVKIRKPLTPHNPRSLSLPRGGSSKKQELIKKKRLSSSSTTTEILAGGEKIMATPTNELRQITQEARKISDAYNNKTMTKTDSTSSSARRINSLSRRALTQQNTTHTTTTATAISTPRSLPNKVSEKKQLRPNIRNNLLATPTLSTKISTSTPITSNKENNINGIATTTAAKGATDTSANTSNTKKTSPTSSLRRKLRDTMQKIPRTGASVSTATTSETTPSTSVAMMTPKFHSNALSSSTKLLLQQSVTSTNNFLKHQQQKQKGQNQKQQQCSNNSSSNKKESSRPTFIFKPTLRSKLGVSNSISGNNNTAITSLTDGLKKSQQRLRRLQLSTPTTIFSQSLTPKSLLKTEMDTLEADESLLISPNKLNSSTLSSSSSSSSSGSGSGSGSGSLFASSRTKNEPKTVEKKKNTATTNTVANTNGTLCNDIRSILKQKSSAKVKKNRVSFGGSTWKEANNVIADDANEERQANGNAIQAQGNRIRMDLSSMFSEVDRTPIKKNTQAEGGIGRSNDDNHPKKKVQEVQQKDIPTAYLSNYQEGIWVDFGDERNNVVGISRSLFVILEAPSNIINGGDCFLVEVEKVPTKKGFELSILSSPSPSSSSSSSTSTINRQIKFQKSKEQKRICIKWTPIEQGGVRETILLKLPKGRLRISLLGRAKSADTKKTSKQRSTKIRQVVSRTSDSQGQVSKIEASTLTVSHNPKTPCRHSAQKALRNAAITPHRTAKKVVTNILDDSWAEKQCDSFAKWLNYTFSPTEDVDHETGLQSTEDGEQHHSSQSIDRAALRTLILHQRIAQSRLRALELFKGGEMQTIQATVGSEIKKGRLSLRSDRDLYADLTLRGQILSLLLSYSTPWLRLGLETLFGESIAPENPTHFSPSKATSVGTTSTATSPSTLGTSIKRKTGGKVPASRMKKALKHFIVKRVLSDSATLMKYTKGKCKVPSGEFEKQYRADLRFISLHRLLVLIIFLDRAKKANLLEHATTLFTKASKVKSSREVLESFCRDFLKAEGNIIKHLSRIGIKVSYKQEPVDEIDFTITNLAVDIRDGVRLARLIEILTCYKPKTLMAKLRLPAVSRLQKLHNVGVVLNILRDAGVPNIMDIAAHHIVDGHREMVLKLMWSIVAHYSLDSVLDLDRLELEIDNVRRANRSRRMLSANCTLSQENYMLSNDNEGRLKALLLQWCHSICSSFGCPVKNFTTSFADGRALCLLLHYYHPCLIKLKEILPTTTDPAFDCKDTASNIYQEALNRERMNSELASARMSGLGGIPRMLPVMSSENIPEEKSMILCLSYLCARLMESSREILAIISIQIYYRRYRARIELEEKKRAASIILANWRDKKTNYYASQRRRYIWPVRTIEQFVTTFKNSLAIMRSERLAHEEQQQAAIVIQKHARMYVTINQYYPLILQTICARKIQTQWRRYFDQHKYWQYRNKLDASIIIQRTWRGHECRTIYAIEKYSAVVVQASFRGYLLRRELATLHNSAVIIQSVWRGFYTNIQYHIDMIDLIVVQSIVRRKAAIKRAKIRAEAILKLQCAFRRFIALRLVHHHQIRKDTRDQFLKGVLICQSIARRKIGIQNSNNRRKAIFCIQSAARKYLAVKMLEILRTDQKQRCRLAAAVKLQSIVRRNFCRSEIPQRKSSILTLQKGIRGCLAKEELIRLKKRKFEKDQLVSATLLCQAMVRRKITVTRLKTLNVAASVIQAAYRSYEVRKRYEMASNSAVKIQSHVRGYLIRLESKTKTLCATKIQTLWRGRSSSISYQSLLRSIIIIQSSIRRRMALAERKKLKESLLCIQGAFRVSIATNRLVSLQAQKVELARIIGCRRRESATCLQACFRRYTVRREIDKRRASVIILQRAWKRVATRKRHYTMQICANRIQRCFRKFMNRREMEMLQQHATAIQSLWRRYSVAARYHLSLQRTIYLQSIVRRWIVESKFRHTKEALLTIQCAARVSSAIGRTGLLRAQKEETSKELGFRRRVSATRIQSFFRAYLVRREFHMKITCAVKLQEVWRSFSTIKRHYKWQIAATIIQGNFRGYLVRREMRMHRNKAIAIQCSWRRYAALTAYQSILSAIVPIQSLVRRLVATVECSRKKKAVLSMQCAVRVFLASSQVVSLRAQKEEASRQLGFTRRESVTKMQSYYRGYVVRRDLSVLTGCAVDLQRIWRGFYSKIQYHMDLIDLIVVQSVCRRRLANLNMEKRRKSIVQIQQAVRVWRANQVVNVLRATRLEEIKKIRSQHIAATMIQKTWRCYTIHIDYMISILSAISVQSVVRRHLAVCKFERATMGLIKFQAVARGVRQRSFYSQTRESAVTIQSSMRSFIAVSFYRRKKNAVTAIQRVARGLILREELEMQHFAASEIQRIVRGYCANIAFLIKLYSIVKIQSLFRMRISIKKAMAAKEEKIIDSVCIIQRAYRSYSSSLKFIQTVGGLTKFQSIYRGRIVRMIQRKKVRDIAFRVRRADIRAKKQPHMKLSVRTASALKVLQTSTRLSELIEALLTLEMSTRLSDICCKAFADACAPGILYRLIRTCNRSLPHVELLHHVLLTLINISKHKILLPYVATDTSVDVLIDLVQMFRDKEEVFCLATYLLEKVVSSGCHLMEICKTKENLKRLKGIYALSERKLSLMNHGKNHIVQRKQLVNHSVKLEMKSGVNSLRRIISRAI